MAISTVRIGKEVRALFWPWCGLMAMAALLFLPLRNEPLTVSIATAGFLLGLPLLATLSLGYEFQHGTAPLLFAQPIDRSRIWREKWIVLVPAMAILAAIYLGPDVLLRLRHDYYFEGPDPRMRAAAIVWVITVTCTAPFWTLVGRSILNGFLLNIIQGFVGFWIWMAVNSMPNPKWISPDGVIAAAPVYALLMLWLGWRRFANFEVAGGSASAELLMPASERRSHSPGWLRSRPGQPILNLIRKELRLLWLVWILEAVMILGVVCLAGLRLVPATSINTVAFWVSGFVLTFGLLAAILAGSLSIGEERTSGTQSWHRTLPMSGATQWFIKLTVVLSASFLALVLPLTLARFAVGRSFVLVLDFGLQGDPVLSLSLFCTVLGFAAFWCGCLVKGTVRAALLAVPALGFVLISIGATEDFVRILLFEPALDPILLRFHPFPFVGGFVGWRAYWSQWWIVGLVASALLVAIAQSLRFFRSEASERFVSVLRPLLEVSLAAFVVGVVLGMPFAVVNRANQLTFDALREVADARARILRIGFPVTPDPSPLSIEKLHPLSETTRLVLRDATILVHRSARSELPSMSVRFRNGMSCAMEDLFRYMCEPQSGK